MTSRWIETRTLLDDAWGKAEVSIGVPVENAGAVWKCAWQPPTV
jgi:hypothetical protein